VPRRSRTFSVATTAGLSLGSSAERSVTRRSFLAALANDYAAVVDMHAAVKLFTNDLKSQFLTVLALDIPDDVASDND